MLLNTCRLSGDEDGTAKWGKMLEDSVDLCSDEDKKAGVYSTLASFAEEREDFQKALAYYQRAYETYRRLGAPLEETQIGNCLGSLLLKLGLPDQAKPYLDRALELSMKLKHKPKIARSYLNLSRWAALDKRESRQYAVDLGREALRLFQELNDETGIAMVQALLDDINAGKYD